MHGIWFNFFKANALPIPWSRDVVSHRRIACRNKDRFLHTLAPRADFILFMFHTFLFWGLGLGSGSKKRPCESTSMQHDNTVRLTGRYRNLFNLKAFHPHQLLLHTTFYLSGIPDPGMERGCEQLQLPFDWGWHFANTFGNINNLENETFTARKTERPELWRHNPFSRKYWRYQIWY